MGNNVSLSVVQRAQIVALLKHGYSERLISEKMKCSNSSVHKAVVKFQNTGSYSTGKNLVDQKNTLSKDHIIRRIAVWSPMSFAEKIQSALLAKGTKISRRSVIRRLVDDFGLKAFKPAHKPCLTLAMKNKRLAFAKKECKMDKTAVEQSTVIFLDESTVQQFTTRKRYIRRPIGKQFDERYTIQTMKYPPSVMI